MKKKKKSKFQRKKLFLSSKIPKYSNKIVFTTEDSIEKLRLPSNIESVLIQGNIKTIGRLIKTKRKKLYKIKNLGNKSVKYIMKIKRVINQNLNKGNEPKQEPSDNLVQKFKTHQNYPLPEINSILRFSRNHSISVLGLPIRMEHALQQAGIHRLGELYDYPEKKLLKEKNIGKRSLDYINYVKSKIVFGSNNSTSSDEDENKIPNDQLISYFLNTCGDDRTKEVIQRRYGLVSGEKETLEEIGTKYGLTRERIRQIQVKAKKRLNHLTNLSKKPIINIVEDLIRNNGWIISDVEADKLIPTVFRGLNFDGSSLLDLLKDLGWIQNHEIGDVLYYSPKFGKVLLGNLMDSIIKILKKKQLPLRIDEIIEEHEELKKINIENFNATNFVLRSCHIDPRIEEKVSGRYGLYIQSNRTMNLWVPLMVQVLETEETPLHFTEISEKVNDLLLDTSHKLDQRRAHAILVQKNIFAHVGIRGMYGLTSWGLRKESTTELVTEYIKSAGFPVHIEQIYDYVKKYKNSPKMNIRSILDISGKFENKGHGLYDLKRN